MKIPINLEECYSRDEAERFRRSIELSERMNRSRNALLAYEEKDLPHYERKLVTIVRKRNFSFTNIFRHLIP